MGLFDKLLKKEEEIVLNELEGVSDEDIVAIADGELVDVKTVTDEVFAQEMMGKTAAFRFENGKVVLCSPANGTLTVLFPTGHAYGITMNNGVELLVHCGVNTVETKGDGFRLLNRKQGDCVKAGDPIVEVDISKLSQKYDMSTMLIITNQADKDYEFIGSGKVSRGDKVTK